MRLNIPNILSLLRLFLIPVFVVVFYLPYQWAPFAAAMVFWVAGFTDWLDGMLARKLGQTSRFGALTQWQTKCWCDGSYFDYITITQFGSLSQL